MCHSFHLKHNSDVTYDVMTSKNSLSGLFPDPKCYFNGRYYSTRDPIMKNCNLW